MNRFILKEYQIKYIKYPHQSRLNSLIKKQKLTHLNKTQIRNNRINYILYFLFLILYFTLFIGIFVFMIIEMKKINSIFLTILFVIGCVLFDIIVPPLIISLLAFFLGKFVPHFTYSKLKPDDIPYITTDIRKYYHYSKPFLVTKCFDCTNELFKNKDVFIFIGPNSEIRITVNLLRTYRDLGCYYFNKNEIKCEYIEVDNKIRTLLKVNDKFSFVLGNKAKPFIKKCFTPSPCPCCGSLVFNKAARGMFAICPICNWEDDLEQEKDPTNSDGANNVCLNEARINYKKYGRCGTPLDLRCSKPEKDELKE